MPETVSKSKRTKVTVEMEDDGRLVILVDRDGQRLLNMPFEKEPIQKVGT